MNTDLYILREEQPIDLQALRSAFVVAVDSERLGEAVKRDMRAGAVLLDSRSALDWATDEAAQLRQQYESHQGVSVIIPSHNYAQFIGETLASLTAQTCVPDEIIVVEDASSDNSREVIQHFIDQHPQAHIRLIVNPHNLDLAETQNVGIRAATQEHIVCLDADDKIEPRYIETLHEAMLSDRSLGVAYCGVQVLHEGEIHPVRSFPPFSWEWMTEVADPPRTCIPKPSMFRRAMWARCGGFQQTYRAGEDVDFWLRGLATGFNARKVTDEPLFTYRVHGNQQMSRARTFTRIDHYKPWMRDGRYPFAAPSSISTEIPASGVPDYTHPAVSVIIPVGPGHEAIVRSALESVLGQTVRDWEVIVVRDTTGTMSLDAYPFARVIEGGCNGVAHARNVGIEAARAPLVCFLDADDWLEPFALQQLMTRYSAGDAGYVYSDWIEQNADGSQTRMEAGDYVHDLQHARGYYGGITVVMARADAMRLGGFDDSAGGLEDWDFFIRAMIAGICGARVNAPTFAYRKHTGARRLMSGARAPTISKIFFDRYNDYRNGSKPMAACCGGNGEATLAAKRAVDGLPAPDVAPSGNLVQMQYVGRYGAPVTFFGRYVGANTPADQYAHDAVGTYGVDPRDVEKMANTGQWRVVESVASIAPEPRVSMIEPEVLAKIERAEAIEPLDSIDAEMIAHDMAERDDLLETVKAAPKPKRGKRNA